MKSVIVNTNIEYLVDVKTDSEVEDFVQGMELPSGCQEDTFRIEQITDVKSEHGIGTCDNCQTETEIDGVWLCDCKQSIQLCFDCDSIPEVFCECGKQVKPIMDAWKLNRVDKIEYTPDASGVYVLICWEDKTNTVRLDFMSGNHKPIISFAGESDNVRKATMAYLETIATDDGLTFVSLEHAAYIGSELEKADTMRIDYVQDGVKTVTFDSTALTDSELIEKTERENKKKAEDIAEKYYDVQDIINAECSLEPVKCRHCGIVGETTFNQGVNDAFCASCGKWQLSE